MRPHLLLGLVPLVALVTGMVRLPRASATPAAQQPAPALSPPALLSDRWASFQPVAASTVISQTRIGRFHLGRAKVEDSAAVDFGTGGLDFSVNAYGQTGFIYGHPTLAGMRPVMTFADLKLPSDCLGVVGGPSLTGSVGYTGPARICSFQGDSGHVFMGENDARQRYWTEVVGDRQSGCHAGLLLFRQDGKYGAIDPVDVGEDGALTFDWWYDESGDSDFSPLCAPTPTAEPPRPPSLFLPFAVKARRPAGAGGGPRSP